MGFSEKTLIFLDVETTGLSPASGDRVIEIAALKVVGLKPAGEFHSLIHPGQPISYGAYLINGISDAMLKGQPKASQVLPEFLKFAQGASIVGHNVKFDLKFMNHELALCGMPLLQPDGIYDTVKMARILIPELGRYSLDVLTRHFGIHNAQQHRAASDTYATFELFMKMFDIAQARQLHHSAHAISFFSIEKPVKVNKRVKLKIINEAIAEGSVLDILYQGAATGLTTRRIRPTQILGTGRKAMLEGYCHLRAESRSFSIDRIATITVLGEEVSVAH